jgi:WD40 repeat protein
MPPTEYWWIVLADFGISKRANEDNAPTTTIKGTDGFKAPELLGFPGLPRPKEISDFQAADMWALGEIAFQMLTGKPTFESQWELMAYSRKERKFPLDLLPLSAKGDGEEFILNLMRMHPDGRITTIQGLEHCWMASQYTDLQENIGVLSLGHSSSPERVRSSVTPNHSARWTNLSRNASEPAKMITQWKPGISFKSDPNSPMRPSFVKLDTSQQNRQNMNANQDSQSTLRPKFNKKRGDLRQSEKIFSEGKNDREVTTGYSALTQEYTLWEVNMLRGHGSLVKAVAFTPDGKTLASASTDGTIRLWDGYSGAALAILEKHSDHHSYRVTALSISQDGRTIASASGTTISLWDIQSKEIWEEFHGISPDISQMAFSPDGKSLTSISLDGTITLWSTQSSFPRKSIAGGARYSMKTAFSPDGKTLATLHKGTMTLWDCQSVTVLKAFQVDSDSGIPVSIALSPDSGTIASVSDTVVLWDTESGVLRKILEDELSLSPAIRVGAVVFSPDGRTLAASFHDVVRLWDSRSGALLQTLDGHSGRIISMAFSPDSKVLATALSDDNVGLWTQPTLLPSTSW